MWRNRAGWLGGGLVGLLVGPAMAGPPADGLVRVAGTVTYDGPIPNPIPIPEAGTVRHWIEVDTKTGGLRDAVIWLEGVPKSAIDGDEPLREPVVVDQREYAFVPHVVAVEAGRAVEFRNGDAANHGVTSRSREPKNRFDLVTPPGGSQTHRFVAEGSPVAIGCPVHGSMSAWVYVFDHPYHAVTDRSGRFRLPPVPPGRYTLQLRHPDGGLRRQAEVIVQAGEPLRLRIDLHGGDRKPLDHAGRGPSH